MNLERAFSVVETLGKLLTFAVRSIRSGHPERVGKILPTELHTTLAKALADAEAEERLARRDEPTARIMLDPERNGAGHE